MATFERATVVDASLSTVWDFHSGIEGLLRLTPRWTGLRIESIERPEGSPTEALTVGTIVRLRTRPGVSWTSKIVERDRERDRAMFRDELIDGPFERFEHTHWFIEIDLGTIVYDHVEFAPPRPVPAFLFRPAFASMFRDRHRRTRTILE